jgi:hypothetical protein
MVKCSKGIESVTFAHLYSKYMLTLLSFRPQMRHVKLTEKDRQSNYQRIITFNVKYILK